MWVLRCKSLTVLRLPLSFPIGSNASVLGICSYKLYIFFAWYTFIGAMFCSEKEAYLTHIKALDLGISKRTHYSLFSEYDHVNPVFQLCSSHVA